MPLKNQFSVISILLFLAFGMNISLVYGKNGHSIFEEKVADSLFTGSCSDTLAIEKIIADAIELGAPIYNAGLHIGCYRIYEWAAYKILYLYGNNCRQVEKILKATIEKTHGDYSDTEKAWLMRVAFDKILGVTTKTGNAEDASPEKEYPQKG